MVNNKIVNHLCFLFFLFLVFTACDDMKDKERDPGSGSGSDEVFILSEGLINMNNSALAKYDPETGMVVSDYFLQVNKRGLGDTANDMEIYGSKLYIVVNVSSCVEVVDVNTGKSLKQIPLFSGKNIAREPRNICFDAGKAYVCSFDGTVSRIDTTSLQVEAVISCGRNPDGICATGGKLYVSNSGGLNFPDYDNTVSVVDVASFVETHKITVGVNPYTILPDSEGDVYVVSRENYGEEPYKFQKINTKTGEVRDFDGIHALNFTIHNDTAYIYSYNYAAGSSWVKTFDCRTEQVISDHFITDGTELDTPYGINVNPLNGDVYLTDAKSHVVWGDVLCFDRYGQLKFRINEVGLNPGKVVFKYH